MAISVCRATLRTAMCTRSGSANDMNGCREVLSTDRTSSAKVSEDSRYFPPCAVVLEPVARISAQGVAPLPTEFPLQPQSRANGYTPSRAIPPPAGQTPCYNKAHDPPTASGMASFYLTGALTDARVESGYTGFCAHPCVPSMGPIGSERVYPLPECLSKHPPTCFQNDILGMPFLAGALTDARADRIRNFYRTGALTDAQMKRNGFYIKMLQKCDQWLPGRANGASRPGPGRARPATLSAGARMSICLTRGPSRFRPDFASKMLRKCSKCSHNVPISSKRDWGLPPKLAKSGLEDAPQRRGYTRSLPMGPIDGTHGKHRKSSKMQEIMPDTVQEWHAEEVIFDAFLMNLQAFWPPKLSKSGFKHAPQRRGYTRSLPMGPIDGTHGCNPPQPFRAAACLCVCKIWGTPIGMGLAQKPS
eukprot:gene14556-biopygen5123